MPIHVWERKTIFLYKKTVWKKFIIEKSNLKTWKLFHRPMCLSDLNEQYYAARPFDMSMSQIFGNVSQNHLALEEKYYPKIYTT